MILMSDFYKQAHAEQYPEGITKLISYATARMTRMPKEMLGDKLTQNMWISRCLETKKIKGSYICN